MKKLSLMFAFIIISGLFWGYSLNAKERQSDAYMGSKAFERMKELVGVWEGTSNKGSTKQKISVAYRSTAGGSAIEETLFPGAPEEMVSLYHDHEGNLIMTHYCMLRNQPKMKLMTTDENTFNFIFTEGSNLNPMKDPHMHALSISFVNENHIVHRWTLFVDGKEKEVNEFTLFRIE